MNRRSVAAILLVIAALTAVGGLVFVGLPSLFGLTTHGYSYQTTISTNETLRNATFYLPVPADGGTPTLEDAWIVDEEGNRTDWETAVVETERGPMLRVHADRVEGERRWRVFTFAPNGSVTNVTVVDDLPADMSDKEAYPEPTTYHVYAQWDTDAEIDTRSPLGAEPVLSPRGNLTPVRCEWPVDEDEEDRCYVYRSAAFARFQVEGNASAETPVVRISGDFGGSNEWGFALSNSYNTYTQRYGPVAFGADGGWRPVNVTLHAGEGRYPTVNY